jgi:hypothetical protein
LLMVNHQTISDPLMILFDPPKRFLTEFDLFLAGLVKTQ